MSFRSGCWSSVIGIPHSSVLGGPLASLLHDATGSWIPVFALVIGIDLATATLAYFVLKQARAKYLRRAAR